MNILIYVTLERFNAEGVILATLATDDHTQAIHFLYSTFEMGHCCAINNRDCFSFKDAVNRLAKVCAEELA